MRLYTLLKILELNAEKATFWRISLFFQQIYFSNDEQTIDEQAIAIKHNLASYFELHAHDIPSTLKPEHITAVLLNYLPR